MLSDRMQRQLDRLLDEGEAAVTARRWDEVGEKARAALAIEADNADALTFLRMAEANLGAASSTPSSASQTSTSESPTTPAAQAPQPASFAGGRYAVRRFLGEGGKKRVFLAHDQLLDRDVALALIKTEGLEDVGRERIKREAQAMGRMGTHPHMVSVFDLGEEGGAPFIVTELMAGGDVEGELEKADGPLELTRSLEIAKGVARGLAFAHERGIVHRDLKPGNVWLTSEGVAKIGDFGLAVAQGRSRLTQHGLMVGTFGYMPPEQALGNEATPQSDLYSLGCMLYELVTGKQPFTGDTPTSVISQHLNAAPVAPSWHTGHCPPALEDLILALMAKEPAARPASAQAVLSVLEGVDPAERSRSHSDSQANPLDRLAHGVFVGRDRELERLRSALDGALSGHGSLVMLVGEPGIGKTRTTQELETYARMRGAKVLWGRAVETAGAPPYWPWVQAARDYRDQTDEELRRRQYQPYAVELQRILPGLRDLFPNLPEPPGADTEEGQFRLYDALASFLRSVAAETPLVVVLDDLHWADRATLNVLTHLTRDLGRARILVLGTYRDTDLDRRHPLSQALSDLNREDLFTRIPLRGLSLAETTDYIGRTAGVTVSPLVAHRIFEETEGNPFFLSEVVNLMTEEGTLAAPGTDVQIPEGVRQALGRRLDRLSGDANALLTMLAVVGREFDHAMVLALSEHDSASTLRLVEEALRARVLEETGVVGRYRFSHALMQETLLDELSAARKVLLHGQIADAMLAIYGPENRDHLARIAEHYAESAVLNPAHARLAAQTLRRAAETAAAALVWDEAARLYERCLELVVAAPNRLGEDEGILWRELAITHFKNTRSTAGWEAFDRAVTLLESRPDELAPAAVRIALGGRGLIARRRELWPRLVESVGGAWSEAACQLLAVLASANPGPAGDDAAERARAIAQSLGIEDPRLAYLLARREASNAGDQMDFPASARLYEELRSLGSQVGALDNVINGVVIMTLIAGDLDRFAQAQSEWIATCRAYGRRQLADEMEAVPKWNVDRLVGPACVRENLDKLPQTGARDVVEAGAAMESGDPVHAAALISAYPFEGSAGWDGAARALRCRVFIAGGDMTAATAAFEEWRPQYEANQGQYNVLVPLAQIDDSLCLLADRETLDRASETLKTAIQARGLNLDYLRGAIALTLDRVDEAEEWFQRGIEWTTRWGLDTATGRNLFGLAQVAERRGDHALAMEHLDAAGALFAKQGAKLYLDQVIDRKEILKA